MPDGGKRQEPAQLHVEKITHEKAMIPGNDNTCPEPEIADGQG